MPKKVEITPDVEAVLARATVHPGNVLKLPDEQLARPLYEAVNKVLVALGGKWNRSAQGHVFAGGLGDQLATALASGVAVDQKRTMEQFFTPSDVAARVVHLAQIRAGAHVLEPSAGSGRLVLAALAMGAIVTAVELDRDWCGAGGKDGKGGLMDIAAQHHGMLHIFGCDFLEWRPAGQLPIDRVIMNPPFGNRADIVHVGHAYGMLRPGGRLVSIMSPSWQTGSTHAAVAFRTHVKALLGDWFDLPPNTFRQEGTDVNAGLLILTKPS